MTAITFNEGKDPGSHGQRPLKQSGADVSGTVGHFVLSSS